MAPVLNRCWGACLRTCADQFAAEPGQRATIVSSAFASSTSVSSTSVSSAGTTHVVRGSAFKAFCNRRRNGRRERCHYPPKPGAKRVRRGVCAGGGVTIDQAVSSNRCIYYYAHLVACALDVYAGDRMPQGQIIGFVSMTGNARVPHLHVEIDHQNDAHQWWRVEATNPHPYFWRKKRRLSAWVASRAAAVRSTPS
jgi:hypothetical protein